MIYHFKAQSKKWLKAFNHILFKSLRKVRICESKKKKNDINQDHLIKERIKLKKINQI